MSWIQTYSGVQFWPLDPRQKDVRLKDIAHALAQMCRFNGHCRTFYSVAQHSVLVLREMRKRGFADDLVAAALFHDAAEAYLPDVCRPIKREWKEFREIEGRLLATIYSALDIRQPSCLGYDAIKTFDDVLLATEARDLFGPHPAPWPPLPSPLTETIMPWSPTVSERAFLMYAEEARRRGE